jgi:hypothetical protein
MREKMAERVFEPLYGTPALHSSKDGFTLQRPTQWELNRTPNDHSDQGFTMRGLNCIQGSVALTDQTRADGCFQCWPGSHRYRAEIIEGRGEKRGRKNFVILNDWEKDFLRTHGIEAQRVPVNRGDIILWRSDLVHCGAPPIGARDNFRAVVYICMLPAAMTPATVYPRKLQAYEQLETGSHWPNEEEWFESDQRRHSAQRPFFQRPPQLTERQRLLYGLEPYTQGWVEEWRSRQNPGQALPSSRTVAQKEILKLEKVLREIAKLKQQRDGGIQLEKNQVSKIAREEELQSELAELLSHESPAEAAGGEGDHAPAIPSKALAVDASALGFAAENASAENTSDADLVMTASERVPEERRARPRGGRSGFRRKYHADH